MLVVDADRSLLEQYSIFASLVVSLALKTLQGSLSSTLFQLKIDYREIIVIFNYEVLLMFIYGIMFQCKYHNLYLWLLCASKITHILGFHSLLGEVNPFTC